MWSRIWCKDVQNARNLSSSILHYIIHLLYYHIGYMVLYRANSVITPSRCSRFYDCCSLHEVSHSWIVRIWHYAEHPEVSSDTICSNAPCGILINTTVHSYRYCLCFGSLYSSWVQGSSTGSINFTMDIIPNVSHLCDLCKEI